MKILLINPPRFNGHPMVREMRCAGLSASSIYPPLELAYLAGLLRLNAMVKILDANALNLSFENVKNEIERFHPDWVVYTTSPASFAADMRIATITKEIDKGIKTILLDSHILPVMSEEIKQKFIGIDYFVSSEPLLNVPGILGLEGIADLENHPLPAYDLLPIRKYFSLTYSRRKPFGTITTSTGCPNRCKFCIVGGSTVKRGYGNRWQFKSAKKILDEVKFLLNLGIRSIYFFDETFTVNPSRVIDVCQGIIDQNLKFEWSCNGRVDTLNEEIIKMMKKAGCWNIMFGIECGSEELLKDAHKGTTLEKALAIVEICKKNKLKVSASFLLGLPEETMATIKKTLAVAKRVNPYRAQFVVLTPYPGTQLYEEMKKEGLLLRDYDFSGYDAYCVANEPVIKTRHMSSAELARAQKYIYRRFYFRPSFLLNTLFSVRSWSHFINLINSVLYLK